MFIALCLVLQAGCIDSDLVLCGDTACPVGTVCHPNGGSCLFPTQLSACASVDEGAPCELRGNLGACVGGICEVVGCGNRVITPDEICDDGNTSNGDGCSADCRSNEMCGNGTVDSAASEQCDDANLIDGDGCSSVCALPRCGDGLLDGFEECDPALTLASDRTCEDFGYYAGELACNSICRLDPTQGCTGRCGDLTVQTAYEDCDTAPPNGSCVDYGFDFGALTCSAVCAADPVRSCNRFGWRDLGVTNGYNRFRGDGDTVIVFDASGTVFDGLTRTIVGTNLSDADVLGDQVLLATPTNVQLRATAGGAFTTLTPPTIPAGSGIRGAALANDGTPLIVVGDGNSCLLEAYSGGTWTSTPTLATCGDVIGLDANNYLVHDNTTLQWTFPGGTRSYGVTNLNSVQFRSAGAIRIHTYDGATVRKEELPPVGPGSGQQAMATGSFAQVVVVGDEVYATDSAQFGVSLYRVSGSRTEKAAGSPSTTGAPNRLFATRDGRVYSTSNAHVYALSALLPTARVAPTFAGTPDLLPQTVVALTDAGDLVYSGKDVWLAVDQTFQKVSTTAAQSTSAVWGTSSTNIYIARVVTGVSQLWRYNGSTVALVLDESSNPISAVTVAGEGTTVVVVGSTGTMRRRLANTWQDLPALPPNCSASAVRVVSSVVYAAGGCAGTAAVWTLGADWTELVEISSSQKFASLFVASDGTVFAAANNGVVVSGQGTTWATSAADVASTVAGHGTTVFGTYGGSQPGSRGLKILSDGRWTPVNIDKDAMFGSVAVGPRDMVTLSATYPTPTPMRLSGFILPPGEAPP